MFNLSVRNFWLHITTIKVLICSWKHEFIQEKIQQKEKWNIYRKCAGNFYELSVSINCNNKRKIRIKIKFIKNNNFMGKGKTESIWWLKWGWSIKNNLMWNKKTMVANCDILNLQ